MIKKFVAWIKALFAPAKIEDVKVDEYITQQFRRTHDESDVVLKATVKVDEICFSKPENRPVSESLAEDEVVIGVDTKAETVKVVKVEARKVEKVAPTPPKPLNDQLKGVELPSYAKGKTLPPKAKRQFIKQSKAASPRKMSDSPTAYGTSQVHPAGGVDPVNAALYGYAAAAIMQDDTPAVTAPVEECRSSAATSSYSSNYSSYDDSSSYSSSSSSSSYDSGSYDSGSSYSSCD